MKKWVIIGVIVLVIIIGIIIFAYVKEGCETDADCLTKNCFTVQCIKNNCIYSPIINCCGNEICEINETYLGCAVDCPSCEDYNDCTIDKYDYHEQKCVNKPIIPCCGNEICDENVETNLDCSTDCPDCNDNNKLTTDSFNYATQKCENPVTHYFFDDFESGIENWVFHPNATAWSITIENGNTVLKGIGHNWASLQEEWDNFIFKFRFKRITGSLAVNFRFGQDRRYLIHLDDGGTLHLHKQLGPVESMQELKRVQFSWDKNWHTFEIRGYGNILNIYLNDELLIKYKDTEDPILSGRAAFENGDDSEFLIDDVEIKLITEKDIIYP